MTFRLVFQNHVTYGLMFIFTSGHVAMWMCVYSEVLSAIVINKLSYTVVWLANFTNNLFDTTLSSYSEEDF